MGVFTPNLNLYKPDGTELVDEDAAINDNSDKIDTWSQTIDNDLVTISNTLTPLAFDTDWVWGAGVFTPHANMTDVNSKLRRIGNLVHLHIHGTWQAGAVAPPAGGNIPDTQIGTLINSGDLILPDAAMVTTGLFYMGNIGQKYLAQFLIQIPTGIIFIQQVDSNGDGNIVNGDVINLDAMWFRG